MDVILSLPILIGLIVVALAFDFLNGLHDAANSIATIVSTRVLRPHYAVGWAAFFNFIAFLFFGLHVANTLGPGDPFEQLARACRRAGRRWYRQSGTRRHRLARSRADYSRDRWFAARRLHSCAADGPGAFLDFRALDTFRRRSNIPASAIRVRLALFARPRWQRCTKDNGHHRSPALLAGPSWR